MPKPQVDIAGHPCGKWTEGHGLGETLPLTDLGWTEEQIEAARCRYLPWQQFWDVPEMEAYDDL